MGILPKPKPSERRILHEWIDSSNLGGGCRFLGLDLGGMEQPSVYDALYQDDLIIFSDDHGEDDALTKFLRGPVLACFQRLWRYRMVRCLRFCFPGSLPRYHRVARLGFG